MKRELKKKLRSISRNEIRLIYKQAKRKRSYLSSKIGGKPAVPEGFVWPCYEGTPLSFMAQINLKDVANLDKDNLLPKSGILSFFYELDSMKWGYDPKDKGSARVFYFPDEATLTAAEFPDELENYAKIPEYSVKFKAHISLPESIDDEYDDDDYDECCEELGYEYDDDGERTKLLGYPDVIQNPMEEECETVSRGYSQGNPEDDKKIPEPEKADIKSKADEWIPLFQMGTICDEDSDDDYELMFGDCGHIYFWIKKKDLAECNFDNIWLILQCS